MKKVKLSAAQASALKEICELSKEGFRTYSCVDTYKPVLKLVELKLVTSEPRSYGSIKVQPTKAGIEVNNSLSQARPG